MGFNTVYPHRRHAGPVMSFIFAIVLSVIGYFVAFHIGKPIVDQAKASENWPKISGEIISSKVKKSRDKEGKIMYSADVRYRYSVNGKSFESNRVWVGGNYSSSSSDSAYETFNRYKNGQIVDVYYDPKHHQSAVLEPGAFWSSYIAYGAGLLFLVIGLLFFLSAISSLLFIFGALSSAFIFFGGKKREPSSQKNFKPDTNKRQVQKKPKKDEKKTMDPDDADDAFGI